MKLDKCPLCKGKRNVNDLKTFGDYRKYAFSVLCIETVNMVSDDYKSNLTMEELEQLRKNCETISRYTDSVDRSIYGMMATPDKKENSHDNKNDKDN